MCVCVCVCVFIEEGESVFYTFPFFKKGFKRFFKNGIILIDSTLFFLHSKHTYICFLCSLCLERIHYVNKLAFFLSAGFYFIFLCILKASKFPFFILACQ